MPLKFISAENKPNIFSTLGWGRRWSKHSDEKFHLPFNSVQSSSLSCFQKGSAEESSGSTALQSHYCVVRMCVALVTAVIRKKPVRSQRVSPISFHAILKWPTKCIFAANHLVRDAHISGVANRSETASRIFLNDTAASRTIYKPPDFTDFEALLAPFLPILSRLCHTF